MKKIIIAIDGYSSTGKSTLAKQLAQHLNYIYVDTGAMYRAVTLFALNENLIIDGEVDKEKLISRLIDIQLVFKMNPETHLPEIYLNDQNVEKDIRGMRVSGFVSKIAEISAVRQLLVAQQRKMGRRKGVVMDGRDVGTVIFPEAELKVFMTATPEVRARRRYDELQAKGMDSTYEGVLQNLTERDQIDTSRADSPLRKADDAVEVDNSNLSREEQLQLILKLASARMQ